MICLLPLLCNSTTLACFQILGTLPKDNDKLNNFADGLTSELLTILINLGDTSSDPYDLLWNNIFFFEISRPVHAEPIIQKLKLCMH